MNKTQQFTVLHSGRIKTADGWAESMAIRNGVIIELGSDEEILTHFPHAKETHIDLRNQVVLPGLHDLHVHPVFAGTRERRCKIPQGASLEEALLIVRKAAEKAKPGEWIIGGQWDASALGCVPDRHMLDEVAPNNPVQLEDTSAHSSWANSLALKLAGISSETPDPDGGIIERDSEGIPTGIQRESAAYLISHTAPKPTQKELEEAIEWSVQEMLTHGITSFTEAALGFTTSSAEEMDAYQAVIDKGAIKQRVRICTTWDPGDKASIEVIRNRNLYGSAKVRTDGVKIFLDGVPTDGHTAAMLQPYADTVEGRDDAASRYGMLQIPAEVLNEAVRKFDKQGLTVKFHAAGDAAVRAALDSIEYAQNHNGKGPQMHNVGHCTFVSGEDIKRAARIGATLEVSPYLWQPSPISTDIAAAVGEEVARRVWPIREMVDAGVLVVPGSDWSVVPSVNPWIGIETMVTRQRPGGSKDSFGLEQAITVEEALDIFTMNSAKQEGMADQIGRIEVGMKADLIVVNQNPYEVSPFEIHKTVVNKTMIDGEIVYQKETLGK